MKQGPTCLKPLLVAIIAASVIVLVAAYAFNPQVGDARAAALEHACVQRMEGLSDILTSYLQNHTGDERVSSGEAGLDDFYSFVRQADGRKDYCCVLARTCTRRLDGLVWAIDGLKLRRDAIKAGGSHAVSIIVCHDLLHLHHINRTVRTIVILSDGSVKEYEVDSRIYGNWLNGAFRRGESTLAVFEQTVVSSH